MLPFIMSIIPDGFVIGLTMPALGTFSRRSPGGPGSVFAVKYAFRIAYDVGERNPAFIRSREARMRICRYLISFASVALGPDLSRVWP